MAEALTDKKRKRPRGRGAAVRARPPIMRGRGAAVGGIGGASGRARVAGGLHNCESRPRNGNHRESPASCRWRWDQRKAWGRMRERFFFQAEDGIRGLYVTGVQTCALPI